MGKCQGCGAWNSVVETRITREISQAKSLIDADGGIVLPITDISSEPQQKMTLGLGELNRVLGGGLVRRSVVLVAGDPGIGKST
ncbi:MAG: hypothetical protein QG577_2075, partial [Thermodesulfobacteriota bacterium]|nr:hypothetical protein [Thermodesulfobacteriota bacterium]